MHRAHASSDSWTVCMHKEGGGTQPFCTVVRPHTNDPLLQRVLHQLDHGLCANGRWLCATPRQGSVAVILDSMCMNAFCASRGCAVAGKAVQQDVSPARLLCF